MDRNGMTGADGAGVPSVGALEAAVAQLTAQVAQLQAAKQPDNLSAEELKARFGIGDEHLEQGSTILNAALQIAQRTADERAQHLREEMTQQTEAALDAAFDNTLLALVPDWSQVNNTREFRAWLQTAAKYDELHGAYVKRNAVGCANVFLEYKGVLAAQQAAAAAAPAGQESQWNVPGGAQNQMVPRTVPQQAPTGEAEGPVFALADVTRFLDEFSKGLHRTAAGQAQVTAMNQAIAERRVRA